MKFIILFVDVLIPFAASYALIFGHSDNEEVDTAYGVGPWLSASSRRFGRLMGVHAVHVSLVVFPCPCRA